MINPQPIHIPIEVFHFVIIGKPWVQKNDLIILYRNPKMKEGAFVGHSKKMSIARDHLSTTMFAQFKKQGGRLPIDYPVEVDLVFYVEMAESYSEQDRCNQCPYHRTAIFI